MSPKRVPGNPAKAAAERAERDRARSERKAALTELEPAGENKKKPGVIRRLVAWFFDWLPFWVLGLATTSAMFYTSVNTDGYWPSILTAYLVPLAFTFLFMPFDVFRFRVWRWAIVFGLCFVADTYTSFLISMFGVAWLLHQTYRVEFPKTSRIHGWVEGLRMKWATRRRMQADAA